MKGKPQQNGVKEGNEPYIVIGRQDYVRCTDWGRSPFALKQDRCDMSLDTLDRSGTQIGSGAGWLFMAITSEPSVYA
jgi:hypothetical protein